MTPQQARRALDGILRNAGQVATLQRLSSPHLMPTNVSLRVHVVDFKPHEVDGTDGIQMGDSRAIMSATEILAAEWPAAGESPLPRKGDRLIVGGKTRTVLFAWPAPHLGDELVRIEAAIR